jgi:hypothetical protein
MTETSSDCRSEVFEVGFFWRTGEDSIPWPIRYLSTWAISQSKRMTNTSMVASPVTLISVHRTYQPKRSFSNSGLYNMPVIGQPVLLEVAGTCLAFDVHFQSARMCPSCCSPSRRASANSRASMPGNLWQFLSPEVVCIS